jgi:hypothetical protein
VAVAVGHKVVAVVLVDFVQLLLLLVVGVH